MKNKIVILGFSESVHIWRWSTGLKNLGYDITLISCGGQPLANIETINIRTTSKRAITYLLNKNHVARLIKKIAPDLIHAFLATGSGYWGTAVSPCPNLLTPLGSEITGAETKSWIYRAVLRHIIKRYQYFTTASDYLKNELNRQFPNSKGKTIVIPFGVNIADKIKQHLDIRPIRLIYLKHLTSLYGPDILLEAMNILKSNNFPVELDFYGDEKLAGWLKGTVEKFQLSENVKFCGWLKPEEINTRLLEYDIMVMPSRVESFGVAAVEAGAVGLPVIASDVGGIPEIIDNNKTGLLVPSENPQKLAEAIIRLGDDFELRNKMGESAREKVIAKFNWENNLRTMGDLYERMIFEGGKK
ncbi:MAG: glycosyltransferase family 4 protein [Candidatus Zixiibacteriota bacterium]